MNNINNYVCIQCVEVKAKLKGYNESMFKKKAPRATFVKLCLSYIYTNGFSLTESLEKSSSTSHVATNLG